MAWRVTRDRVDEMSVRGWFTLFRQTVGRESFPCVKVGMMVASGHFAGAFVLQPCVMSPGRYSLLSSILTVLRAGYLHPLHW
jgi:hypothetical protein